jgi:hypothetical protein
MRIKTVMIAGLAFGAASAGGLALASDRQSHQTATGDATGAPLFSDERLAVFDEQDRLLGSGELPVETPASWDEELKGSTIALAHNQSDFMLYIAEKPNADLCVLVMMPGDWTMNCAPADVAADGRLAVRGQNSESAPSFFVGVAPNDVTGVSIGSGAKASIENNVWWADGTTSDDTYIIESSRVRSVVDMQVNHPAG